MAVDDGYAVAVRWERLFAELEATSDDVAAEERDVLVGELADEAWAARSWAELLGGEVVLDLVGGRRVEGRVRSVGETLLRVEERLMPIVIALDAVVAVLQTEAGPAVTTRGLVSRLGWRPVLRAARDEGEPVEVWRRDGPVHAGRIDAVGADFVRLRSGVGAGVVVPFDALSAVRLGT